jgi:cbb3-type cytochrome oxidase subunit 3
MSELGEGSLDMALFYTFLMILFGIIILALWLWYDHEGKKKQREEDQAYKEGKSYHR